MAATIERARAEDPRELRKQIAALNRELESVQTTVEKIERVEVPVLKDAQLTRLQAATQGINDTGEKLIAKAEKLLAVSKEIIAALQLTAMYEQRTQTPHPIIPKTMPAPMIPARTSRKTQDYDVLEVGGGGLRRIMIALAQRPQGLSAKQVAVRSGLSSKSGSFSTYLARARSSGWIAGSRDHLDITEAGLAALGSFNPLPTGAGLLNYWLRDLGDSGAARILQVLAHVYPHSLNREMLAERAGMSGGSGSFSTYLSRLRSLELIKSDHGEFTASEEFFTS
jgi:hypothetical protein